MLFPTMHTKIMHLVINFRNQYKQSPASHLKSCCVLILIL